MTAPTTGTAAVGRRTVIVFCAVCRTENPHTATLDKAGDAVLTCGTPGCGHVLKVPAAALASRATLDDYLEAHKENIKDQVPAAEEEKLTAAKQAAFDKLFAP